MHSLKTFVVVDVMDMYSDSKTYMYVLCERETGFSISDGAGGSGWFFQSDQAHGKVCKYTLCEGDD